MTDKTELTRESLAEYLQHCGPDDQYEPLVRQLLAAMDDRDRHLNNLGRFVSQVAMVLGLPATSAPEVVLRQAAVTFDGAHRYANERDRLQAELAEARAALAEHSVGVRLRDGSTYCTVCDWPHAAPWPDPVAATDELPPFHRPTCLLYGSGLPTMEPPDAD